MKHDESIGKILETSSMILAQPQIIKGTENDSDLVMKNIVVSDCDKAHVLNRFNHNLCADFVLSHDHTFAASLRIDNQCSVICYHFYVLIWLIYMILYTHISNL
jgi:hypothetical protein